MKRRYLLNAGTVPALAALLPLVATADGVIVGKVYDPYVQPLESEIELRFVAQDDDKSRDLEKYSLGVGRSVSGRWIVEMYAIALRSPGETLSIDTYEAEAKWQLTEQGEYAVDWGVLFELERGIEENSWEFTTQLLASRDFRQLTTIANLGVLIESGARIQNEVETTLRVQTRYRWKESLEPAVELQLGQDTKVIGPVIMGLIRASHRRKLRWELGILAGLDNRSPSHAIRANIEFEF